ILWHDAMERFRSTSTSDSEEADPRLCRGGFLHGQVQPWLALATGGALVASCLVLTLVATEVWQLLAAVSAWQAGPKLPQVPAVHASCPCDCEHGPNDDHDATTQAEKCRAGDACFFGAGWCARRTGRASPQPALGECIKRRCGGPRAESFDSGCDRAKEPPFGVTWLVKNFPQKVREVFKDGAPGVNRHMNAPGGSMDASGLHGLRLTISDDLIDTLNASLSRLSMVWRVGCWPPSRYLVASGAVTVSSGWVRLNAAGRQVEVHISDGLVYVKDLRVEISCPGGNFTIAGFGDGALRDGTLTAATLEVDPQTRVSGLRCQGGWGLFCWLVARLAPAELMRSWLPTLLVYAISGCTGMVLGPGCQSRNSFALLTYTHKDCCEAAYRDDYTGCLVGGQFNGRLMPSQGLVQGVECEYSKEAMAFQARCEDVPGSYSQKWPGVCWEADMVWRAPETPGFDGQHLRTQIWRSARWLLAWELSLMLALVVLPVVLLVGCLALRRGASEREWQRISKE
ncbi:unnamed protein product, partial [Effrenium voratum]